MGQDRLADAPTLDLERTAAGGRGSRPGRCERTAAALLKAADCRTLREQNSARNSALRPQRKPRRNDDDRYNNGAPYQRRNLFRASAARRVVGGVIEFSPRTPRGFTGRPRASCPKATRFPAR